MTEAFVAETLANFQLKILDFLEYNFTETTWKDLTIQESSFTNCQFNENNWIKAKIENCRFVNCVFTGNTWQNAIFNHCTFINCEFIKSTFTHCSFNHCLIDSAKFIDQCIWSGTLTETKLLRSSWPDTILDWSEVINGHFYQINFKEKAFPWTKAQGSIFDDCHMGESIFNHYTLANLTFSRCRFDLLDLTQSTLLNVDFIESKINKLMAQKLNAEYLQMGRTAITEGNCEDMIISMASIFTAARLTNMTFKRAKIGMAIFEKADIASCSFEKAEFSGCNLADANLRTVSFTDAKMKNLHLSDTLMEDVTGLT